MGAADWNGEVAALYEKRGLGGRLVAGARPAIIVVDLINGFTDPEFPAGSNLDEVVSATADLLAQARAAEIPVIFTTIEFGPAYSEDNVWLQKMPAMQGLVPGSKAVEVDTRLARREDELLVIKRAASAFTGTDLASILISRQVDTLIVCGATTSGCVRATVVDACMFGWPTFVPEECVGDRAAPPHHASLFDIDSKYGDVIHRDRAMSIVGRSAR